jgi:hypothetical protein
MTNRLMVGIVAGWLMLTQAAGTVWAALGQPASSVQTDQRMLGAAPGAVSALTQQPAGAGYSVAQLQTSAGTTVLEYLRPDGIVFGVSWRGPQPPDLSVLLGSYFTRYQSGTPQVAGSIRYQTVTADDLVVQTGGHMLDLWGRAYVPSLLPAGVSEEVVR